MLAQISTCRGNTHPKTPSAVARGAIYAPCAVCSIRSLGTVIRGVVWVRGLGRGAAVRTAGYGSLARGLFPLGHASANLNVCIS